MRPSSVSRAAIAALCSLSVALTFAPAQQPGFVDEVLVSGFDGPVAIEFDASGRMFVCERRGVIHLVVGGVRQTPPLLDIRDEVGNWRDFGMLGFALDPDFLSTGAFYVMYVVDRHHLLHAGTPSYNANTNDYFDATIGRITRFLADPATGFSTLLPGSRRVLLGETASTGIPILHESHGTGALVMGSDGTLLASTGDGASYNRVDAGSDNGTYYAQALADGIIRTAENVGAFRSQMIGSLNGKILRLDPATGDGVPSNPFFDAAAPRAPRSRAYALGLRNPFRMTLEPGTGSTDPTTGYPGDLYVGDVGWGTWEDVHVIDAPRQNCGWPLFEGHTPHTGYTNALTANLDTPNPLAGTAGCAIPYLRFQDLCKQAQFDHNPAFPNPCDPSVSLPSATPTFMHTRPALDYRHGADDARVPTYSGNLATTAQLGSPTSGTTGAPFRGNCSVGGTWHSGIGWPPGFADSYYHVDYGGRWIRRMVIDSNGSVLHVEPFLSGLGVVVGLCEDPTTHNLLYLDLNGAVHQVRYTNQAAPMARAEVTDLAGPGGRWVHFDARGSVDPEGEALTYAWDFGDGTTSSYPALSHRYAGNGSPQKYEARLEVSDPHGAFEVRTWDVHVDNTAPQVAITSFANGQFYDTSQPTTLPLAASAVDAEHSAQQLSYAWQVFLHHSNHTHPEPIDTNPSTTALLTPTPAAGEFYAYRVVLTVTDPLGLATQVEHWVLPEHVSGSISVQVPTPAQGTEVPLKAPIDLFANVAGPVARVEFYAGAQRIGTRTQPPFHLTWQPDRAGAYVVSALAIANDGSSSSSQGLPIEIRGPQELYFRQTTLADDAEEHLASGAVSVTSSDLELGRERSPQLVGIRFDNLGLPPGATILEAWLEFTTDERSTNYCDLVIAAAAEDSAAPLTSASYDLTSRPRTQAEVYWVPPVWTTVGNSGAAQRTPDLSSILQEIVDRPGWTQSNAMLLLIRGLGRRTAESANGVREVAPLLRVRYDEPASTSPVLRTQVRIAAPLDDAEERVATGQVSVTSSDLELTEDQGNRQLVGMRFALDVPPGATIRGAFLQFTTDEISKDAANLLFAAQSSDDAPQFASTAFDLSNRTLGSASVPWQPPTWDNIGASGSDQRTPDLSALIQEVVQRPGWARGQHIVILVTGTGRRAAESYNGISASAPELIVDYQR